MGFWHFQLTRPKRCLLWRLDSAETKRVLTMSEESDARSGFRLRDLAVLGGVARSLSRSCHTRHDVCGSRANRASTNNNLRQCGVAVHTAAGDYKRLPPSGTGVPTGPGKLGTYGSNAGNLYFHILPYVESLPGPMPRRGGGVVAFFPTYHAPSDPSDAGYATGTSFPFNGLVFNQGGNSVGRTLSSAMPDGTEETIMFATGAIKSNTLRDISAPDPTTCNITGMALPQFHDWFPGEAKVAVFQAFSGGSLSVCLGDANTRQVSPKVSAFSWQAAMVPDDNAIPGSDF